MAKKKLFISSVQSEFAAERKALHEYICADPLLGKFFEPFLFELLPATDKTADAVYLREVQFSDIYLGLLGKEYGFENKEGISPTELEFNHASKHHVTKLIFLTNHAGKERHPKEQALIAKAQEVLVRKKFSTVDELKSAVYAALVNYLIEKEIIRSGPFDASHHEKATLTDIDDEKIKKFVRLAQSKRGFPLSETEPVSDILTHLNLIKQGSITNASILLFGKEPQRFFINSEVRCASFLGIDVEKPIPSYKVFKGTVFELADQALEFVLNKLDYRIETRAEHISIPGGYEIPKEALSEAIVNAIAHRDYTSNASVQVMVFRDRVEIWNPGALPMGWTTEKLKQLHTSVPANPLLAEPLYLAGYIERLGTGTTDMVKKCLSSGLLEPQFIQAEDFKTILYRPLIKQVTPQVPRKYPASTDELPQEFRSTSVEVRNLVTALKGELKRLEIQKILELSHEGNFRDNYLEPALKDGIIEMKYPQKNHPNQKYRLTAKGKALQEQLKKKK
jgi:ATP-dependent DNA helicase RecG